MTDQSAIRQGRKFDQVLEGARTIFMRDGFEGAGVDDIARAAGVSKATLYSYFPDKRVLFMEVALRECLAQADAQSEALETGTAPAAEVLRGLGMQLVGFMLSDFGRRIFRIAMAESVRFPELGRRFYESGPQVTRERIAAYLDRACARGELEIPDTALAAEQFVALCKAQMFPRCYLAACAPVESGEAERVVTGAVEMFMARYARPRAEG